MLYEVGDPLAYHARRRVFRWQVKQNLHENTRISDKLVTWTRGMPMNLIRFTFKHKRQIDSSLP